ncbi:MULTISPECIES: thiamine pyrophosphate-dependent enzyme [unclassified Oceanispirochaeta]|uniref:thiamine pyrophosphate-dependent enzyme n=1 Tax=unclassified Oceanispirochaeta TaxID=2635722 RepID=UPI000E09BAFD|nr:MULTISPECIES: thiamine pyrophosphate-dependent enzyme [unclassified Oceanispirochaeta]MBF9015782.1 transketolase [Oceanispirochaeta sp. M2]NPD72245.1 transketolase [Oceanispirochaeta sp. M1]RDG32342.1 transketolase [Oceanispirochaeta sp. M1]
MDLKTFRKYYSTMVTAREMDLLEQSYTGRGEAFFHVSGAGHEATALLEDALGPQDWLHCHYRDKALMLARGISPEMFFMSLFNKDGAHSKGRQMNAHMSDPSNNILSLAGPVGNAALQSAGVAEAVKDNSDKPIVLLGLGDGMTQQGEVLEAVAHAVRKTLPVLFFIQDNSYAISTKTEGNTFFSRPDGPADDFYGIPIIRLDGRHPEDLPEAFESIVTGMREDRKPRIVVFKVDRLHSHTNADDHRVYRSESEIQELQETGDPIIHLGNWLVEQGVPAAELDAEVEEIRSGLRDSARRAQYSADPEPVFSAKKELPSHLSDPEQEYRGTPGKEALTMIEALRETFRFHLDRNAAVELLGQDLEDPKGDVFGITKTLSKQFPGRVENSPLAEASIVGLSVGRALAGKHPVAFLQFADFLPIAYNQLWADMGSMFWRTDGGWNCPMIVMVSCGGYKPGLGPFHASSMEAVAAHIPGVDVVMPSTAGDAAGLLNAAFESKRPTIFFYPKVCLNEALGKTSADVSRQLVPLGVARKLREGEHISFVSYGNPIKLCMKAAEDLEHHGVSSDVIDLRSISPWDRDTVIASAEKTGRVIVVHEENKTASMSSEIAAELAEYVSRPLQIRRIVREDTHVPCNFDNQLEVLPSYQRILEAAVELLGGRISWKKEEAAARGEFLVEIIGTSPADETATIIEWKIQKGDNITEGQLIADFEADKAAAELKSPVSGVVEELLLEEGEAVEIGTPAVKVKTEDSAEVLLKPKTKETPGKPLISGLKPEALQKLSVQTAVSGDRRPWILDVEGVQGSRKVSNEEIMKSCPGWEEGEILKMTGIESRNWIAEGEDIISLSEKAAKTVLERNNLGLDDLSLIIVSSGTPGQLTPSLAARIQHTLRPEGKRGIYCPAFDINAACSGYLYALQSAWDFLNSRPDGVILVITAEVLSPLVDPADKSTSPIFGDAATASIITGSESPLKGKARVYRPVTAAAGEPGKILTVPADPAQKIFMHGPKVYLEAVHNMIALLNDACVQDDIKVEDLDLIVPHQANQRIINAVKQRLKLPDDQVYSQIRHRGNTSSCTIPLCLESLFKESRGGQTFGLTAFGGGFTSAGALVEIL